MIIKDLRSGIETTCDNFEANFAEIKGDRLLIFLCEGDDPKYSADFHAVDCAVLASVLVDYWVARERKQDAEKEGT